MFNSEKRGSKILIVEDESIVANDIKKTLERFGYVVDGVLDSGEDVLNIIRDKTPNLILMDIKLKGKMDGIETAEKIKKFDIPIVYLTAYSDNETIERAKMTMPYGFLVKPFDSGELNSVIQMALYKHEAEEKLRESEEKFRYLIDHIDEFVLIVDHTGKILFANRSASNIIGVEKERMIGRLIDEFLTEKSLFLAKKALKDAFSKKLYDLNEVEIKSFSGEIRNLRLASGYKFIKEKGEVIGTLISGQDVTDQKNIEKELKQRNKELESANRIMIGRELKMIELKKHIKKLEGDLKNK